MERPLLGRWQCRSLWSVTGIGGEKGEYRVRVRETPVGLSVSVSCLWSGVCVGNRVVPLDLWDALDAEQKRRMVMSFFKKPPAIAKSKDGGADPDDPKYAKRYPTLWEYLSKGHWPDGEVRKRSSLVVFAEDGKLKGCLSERESELSLWASGSTLEGLLEALEARLTEPDPEWRAKAKKK
jgi:hypothetical protein